MKYLSALALVALAACGVDPGTIPQLYEPGHFGDIMNGSPDVTDNQLDGLGESFVRFAPWLNTREVTLTVVSTLEEARAVCHGDAACSPSRGVAIAPFDLSPGTQLPTEQSLWWSAFNVAHALCHARFYNNGGDGDPTHQHAECFSDVAEQTADDFVLRYSRPIMREAQR